MKKLCLAIVTLMLVCSLGHSARADIGSSANIAAVHLAAAAPADAGQANTGVIIAGPTLDQGVIVAGPKDSGVIITKAAAVDPTQDAPGWVAAWLAQVKGGNYWWAAASALMAAMLIVRKIKPSLFDGDVAGTCFTFGLAFIGALLTSGLAKKAPDMAMLKAAGGIGLFAAGGWSVLWKRFALPILQKLGILKPDAPKA